MTSKLEYLVFRGLINALETKGVSKLLKFLHSAVFNQCMNDAAEVGVVLVLVWVVL